MTGKKWAKIMAARDLLGLGEKASLAEIKRGYRKQCKRYHPDVVGEASGENDPAMHELTEAYQLLLDYCKEYRFPLEPGSDEPVDDEDWWMKRFGADPLWGKWR